MLSPRVGHCFQGYKKAKQAYVAAGTTNAASYAGLLKSIGANLVKSGHRKEATAQYKKAEQAYVAEGATNTVDYANLLESMGVNLGKLGH